MLPLNFKPGDFLSTTLFKNKIISGFAEFRRLLYSDAISFNGIDIKSDICLVKTDNDRIMRIGKRKEFVLTMEN